jgi:nuclear GTP-binding protein
LKGGEPDIEGVARIVLSDWVRGRIPWFVEPPPAPPSASSASGKEKDGKGKGKEKDAAKDSNEAGGASEGGNGNGDDLVATKQNLKKIVGKNDFVGDDADGAHEDEIPDAPDSDSEDGEAGEDGFEEDGDGGVVEVAQGHRAQTKRKRVEAEDEEDEELTWDDVWQGIGKGADADADTGEVGEDEWEDEDEGDEDAIAEDEQDEEEEGDEAVKKAPRMKTNKVLFLVLDSLIVNSTSLYFFVEKSDELLHQSQREEQKSG